MTVHRPSTCSSQLLEGATSTSTSRAERSVLRAGLCAGSALAICVTLSACRSGDSSAPSQSAAAAETTTPGPAKTVRLTTRGGIGFDDLWFSPELHAVLAP